MKTGREAINFDHVERTYKGRKLTVDVADHEVQGFVDGRQVYGVYFDRGRRGLRASMAKAPAGPIHDSFADIVCMSMVIDVINKMYPEV